MRIYGGWLLKGEFIVADVVVIGGGVIGLCTAFSLTQRGVSVTLIDAGPPEHAASHVNAGWIAPTMAEPVPAPGLIATSLRWMLKSDSPLFIEPRMLPNPEFLRWTLRFWQHCNARDYLSSTEAFAAFGANAFALYDRLREAGVRYEEHRNGLVFAYRSLENLERDYAALEPIRPFGYEITPVMSGDALRDLEPALSATVQGGWWLPNERSIRPDTLVRGLKTWLREHGATLREGQPITGIATTG
jgi:D-amino-acid dehydrogenase